MSKLQETPGGEGRKRAARRWRLEPPAPPPDPNGYGGNGLADHAYFAEPARPEPPQTGAGLDSPWTEESAEQWVSELLESKQRLRAQDEALPAEGATHGERMERQPEASPPPPQADTEDEIDLETNDHPIRVPALHHADYHDVPAPGEEESGLATVSAARRRERPRTLVRPARVLAAVAVAACAVVLVTIVGQAAPRRTASSPSAPLLQVAGIASVLNPLQTFTSKRSVAASRQAPAKHIQRAQGKPSRARQRHTPATPTHHGTTAGTTAGSNNVATAAAAPASSTNPVSTSANTSSPTTYTGTPVTQPVATQAPAPASTGSSPSSSAGSTSGSSSHTSTSAKQPAFGAQGVLGPGTSPNS